MLEESLGSIGRMITRRIVVREATDPRQRLAMCIRYVFYQEMTSQENSRPANLASGSGKTSRAGCSAGRRFCRTANRIHGNNAVHLSLLEKTELAARHMERHPKAVHAALLSETLFFFLMERPKLTKTQLQR